ncbi:Desiccation-related protein PCC13-62 [Capsicum baccatum]|uniref:Desiccation-related protein PCC13-62 n=1 Tax=Capsicum baccatum TaxID=33114 RepID=A0A2G2VRG9_CAPBA|nr:Desiccation-related protein PCC13-62 [Capsicum baccatum]
MLLVYFLLVFLHLSSNSAANENFENYVGCDMPKSDVDLVEFPLNLEYLEAEFFLWGSLGYGLDKFAPELADSGPPPIGAQIAKLSPLIRDVITQFGFQEVGHLRAIKDTITGFPRLLLNLSRESFATVMDDAFGHPLKPPFDAYANDVNYLLASYVIPYVGLTGYVGANPKLQSSTAKRLVAGLLGVESGQDAVLRALLYERGREKVEPYGITCSSENIFVYVVMPLFAGDKYSMAYDRTPKEILRIVYGSGKENKPGGFYPKGAEGRIAKSYLRHGD